LSKWHTSDAPAENSQLACGEVSVDVSNNPKAAVQERLDGGESL